MYFVLDVNISRYAEDNATYDSIDKDMTYVFVLRKLGDEFDELPDWFTDDLMRANSEKYAFLSRCKKDC